MSSLSSTIPLRANNLLNDPISISPISVAEPNLQTGDISPASALEKNSLAQIHETYRSKQLLKETSASQVSRIEEIYNAERFHNAIMNAKNSGKDEDIRKKTFGTKDSKWYGASLHTYSAEEYSKMRLFLSTNALCGFALKDVDVVSVFKHINGPDRALSLLMPMAILSGGRRLDCFSIEAALPTQYARYGFTPIARVRFDESYASNDWNKDRDGFPDIVFMVYDKNASYSLDFSEREIIVKRQIDSLKYTEYKEAVELQIKFINENK